MARRQRKSVAGKSCLITGAASGIGRATALATARRGGRLLLTDIDAEGLDRTAADVRAGGGEVLFSEAADISDYEAVAALAERALEARRRPGDRHERGRNLRLGHGRAARAQAVAGDGRRQPDGADPRDRVLRAGDDRGRPGGHLLNVSSAAGLFGFPWHAAYSASKFGLRGVSEVLRFDLRRHGIGVSLCCPGGVDTPLVGTVEIAGVDREDPRMRKLIKRFQSHAQSPEHVAEKMLEGIERDRYMVYTSRDIQFGFWVQRKFAWPYELAMRLANDQFSRLAGPR